MTQYKFKEDKYFKEAMNWIDKTYEEDYHYSTGKIQATENIIDKGHGTGFCMGNIEKLFCRYGLKEGHNKNDLYKIIHYAIIQLYVHEKENLDGKGTEFYENYTDQDQITITKKTAVDFNMRSDARKRIGGGGSGF